jgi:hypothetical protein
MPLDFTKQPRSHFNKASAFFSQHLRSRDTGAYIIKQVTCGRDMWWR